MLNRNVTSADRARRGGVAAGGLQELRSAPWIILLIVKIVLEDSQTSIDKGDPCSLTTLNRCRQMIWETLPDDPLAQGRSGLLMMRSFIYQQFEFQRKMDWTFLRWPSLLAELPEKHVSRRQFVQVIGMEPDVFAGLAWATYTPSLHKNNVINVADYKVARPIFGDSIERFLKLFSRTPSELRDELRREMQARIKVTGAARHQQERNEFPWVSKYPLLTLANGMYAIWHPLVLARGIEEATHKLLAELGEVYSRAFSKIFERYVVSLIKEVGLNPVTDVEFKKIGNSSLAAVDAILEYSSANVFIEAKMSIFADDVIIGDSSGLIYNKLKRVREAIVQAWRVGDLLRNGTVSVGNCAAATEDFLIIVTSRQLFCCSGEHLRRMLGEMVFEDMDRTSPYGRPTEAQIRRLPPRNIVIASIAEFEHLMGCVLAGEVDLPEFLREVGEASSDFERSRMFLDQHLEKKTRQWWTPGVQRRLRDRIEARFSSLLDAPMSTEQE